MKKLIELIFNAENIRMVVILAVVVSGFAWQDAKINQRFAAQDAKMNERFAAQDAKLDGLRYNDFAHLTGDFDRLTNAFKALTFVLRQNNTITGEQQVYIDSTLQ
ncbi:MAG: hypothetical protein LBR23_09975 [Spirochaetaceae bacterium]|jgi:hypothetical protein|nr:hypothetical protein [Spirochaetaceae bacterium]